MIGPVARWYTSCMNFSVSSSMIRWAFSTSLARDFRFCFAGGFQVVDVVEEHVVEPLADLRIEIPRRSQVENEHRFAVAVLAGLAEGPGIQNRPVRAGGADNHIRLPDPKAEFFKGLGRRRPIPSPAARPARSCG